MHHHYSTYYKLDQKMREQEVHRQIEKKYWIEQAQSRKQPRRKYRWRTFIATIVGFFI